MGCKVQKITGDRQVTDIDEVRRHIQAYDRLIELFGMEILEVGYGQAAVGMTVSQDHLNAAGLCHGGAIFSLADVAFALACNSHGVKALALEVSISYMRPALPGERLVARAEEENRGRRTGVYLIRVTNSKGKEVALLKATAFCLDEPFKC